VMRTAAWTTADPANRSIKKGRKTQKKENNTGRCGTRAVRAASSRRTTVDIITGLLLQSL
jgi:hypothetical protein